MSIKFVCQYMIIEATQATEIFEGEDMMEIKIDHLRLCVKMLRKISLSFNKSNPMNEKCRCKNLGSNLQNKATKSKPYYLILSKNVCVKTLLTALKNLFRTKEEYFIVAIRTNSFNGMASLLHPSTIKVSYLTLVEVKEIPHINDTVPNDSREYIFIN